jgi:HlyD family secretion protein
MQAALDYANSQLANTDIKSPITGSVLERLVEQGEIVNPHSYGESEASSSVVALADLTDLQIELDISQSDFARLKIGQRGEIIPEAFPNAVYKGYIEEIAPEANRAKATVQLKVKVENPDDRLRPELNARVNFLAQPSAKDAEVKTNRILVSQKALVRKNNSDYVFVVKGNRVEQRSIRLGEAVGESFYVLEGLSGGESVVTTGADKLKDGDRVKLI